MVKRLSKFSKKELDSFFKDAKCVHKSQAFTILMRPTSNPHGKILPIVSRKYGNAPSRNLLKRRLKNIFQNEELYKNQKIIVVIARSAGKKLSFQELRSILVSAAS